jgi:ribosomal-protein-alanine N-acetyltransferase
MTADDVPEVVQLAAGLRDAPHYAHAVWLAMLAPEASPRRVALVAAETGDAAQSSVRGAVRGFAVASLMPPLADLESIAVAREYQRRGLGRLLISSLISELRTAEVEELWLEVRISNTAATALYRRAGFAETGCRTRYYADPVEDALLMSVKLR